MKRILAEQIVPEKVYLLDNEPIVFHCTKESGWLRGNVALSKFEARGMRAFSAQATVVFVQSGHFKTIKATRNKFDAPWELELWRFSECSPTWAADKARDAEAQLERLTKELNFFQRLKQMVA